MSYDATTAKLFDTASNAIQMASLTAARIGAPTNPSLKEATLSFSPRNISMRAPPKFSDLFDGVGDNTDGIIAGLNDKVDEWLAKYFPSINGSFQNLPEDWLVGVISGVKPFGIDSTIFDLVWHKARDRAYRTTASEQRTLMAAFSQRGFTLPPGALVDAISQSEQRSTDAILDVNRDEAIKDADIKNDILKHAVSIAAQLKTSILNTSAEFFRAYYSVYGLDSEKARARAQAYSAFYGALSSYYGVETSMEQIRLQAAIGKVDANQAIDKHRISVFAESGAASAHAQASRGFSEIAASSANAAGSLVAEIESK